MNRGLAKGSLFENRTNILFRILLEKCGVMMASATEGGASHRCYLRQYMLNPESLVPLALIRMPVGKWATIGRLIVRASHVLQLLLTYGVGHYFGLSPQSNPTRTR
jgi:hypothetical protein